MPVSERSVWSSKARLTQARKKKTKPTSGNAGENRHWKVCTWKCTLADGRHTQCAQGQRDNMTWQRDDQEKMYIFHSGHRFRWRPGSSTDNPSSSAEPSNVGLKARHRELSVVGDLRHRRRRDRARLKRNGEFARTSAVVAAVRCVVCLWNVVSLSMASTVTGGSLSVGFPSLLFASIPSTH